VSAFIIKCVLHPSYNC